ncbi:NAD(P)-dependent alcohol dehydrogenase [Aspergillus ibericus CBS 121593]|uniref:alcohol dehydrogenase (NADP(+)) n=1 Tax=Aspergillus ibericus CBS 121593 TaxID=1448316 RepID=A0A395H911_9EURO|nr:GroES-like protein [Aspergillus ibericus CBS 121593]RAL04332.1 GroES-like protein [Aspergillus ibericus CBS 121593]
MPDQFHGWVAHSPTTPLTFTTFTPKPFTPTDIEVQITHCGICGTDLHTLRSGWGPTDYPCVVGHEIIGIVTRIGSAVQTSSSSSSSSSSPLHLGDRVGIGAQTLSCLQPTCTACASGRENYCPRMIATYNSRYPDPTANDKKNSRTGPKTYGGFAQTWRGPAAFVFRIPSAIPSAAAAPLLCAGVTVFSPLRKYGAGPGKTVAVVGIGGLGHLGILFAKAMGCDRVIGISRTGRKKVDVVEKMGADEFIATEEETGWERRWARTVDVMICTVDGDEMPLGKYLRLLRVEGTFVLVGAPETPLPRIRAWDLIAKGVVVTGSNVGSREDVREMLQVAAEKGVVPWVERRPMEEVNAALRDMEAGRARFRYVLENRGEGEGRESRVVSIRSIL